MSRVQALGCIICSVHHGVYSEAELHHPRTGMGMGQRASHGDCLPICPIHHRTGGYGVALHAGQKAFEKRYGTEPELLAQVRQALGMEEA